MTTYFTTTHIVLLVIALIITGIAFYLIKTNPSENDGTFDILKKLVITFFASLISLTGINYGVNYMNAKKLFEKKVDTEDENIKINDDDVDVDLLEN